MLTREELAEWRKRWDCNCVLDDAEMVDKLLDFAEQMFPLCDALLKLMAAEKRKNNEGGWSSDTVLPYLQAKDAFNTLARELAETETEVKT